MKLAILGSGGNTPIPMRTCQCQICNQARKQGIPYSRNGNSTFYHDENILFDTPEDIFDSLNRENIERVNAVFLSLPLRPHTRPTRPPITQTTGRASQKTAANQPASSSAKQPMNNS